MTKPATVSTPQRLPLLAITALSMAGVLALAGLGRGEPVGSGYKKTALEEGRCGVHDVFTRNLIESFRGFSGSGGADGG